MDHIDVVAPVGALLGESPLWHPDEQVLYWADIEGRSVHRYDPRTGIDQQQEVPWRPGALVRTSALGWLAVAADHRVVWYEWSSGTSRPWIDLEAAGTGNRMNDGGVDPVGRFWVGSMYDQPSAGRYSGHQYRIEGDGSHTAVRHGVGIPNGLAFDEERSRMYYADTFEDKVWRYEYDLDTGTFGEETLFVDFTNHPGRPDGACLDAEGCYWIAGVLGGVVLRFTPDGKLDRRIDLPVSTPTMPAFGGSDLSTLYVTSLRNPAAGSADHQGDLLAIDVGIVGRTEPPFAALPSGLFPAATTRRSET